MAGEQLRWSSPEKSGPSVGARSSGPGDPGGGGTRRVVLCKGRGGGVVPDGKVRTGAEGGGAVRRDRVADCRVGEGGHPAPGGTAAGSVESGPSGRSRSDFE